MDWKGLVRLFISLLLLTALLLWVDLKPVQEALVHVSPTGLIWAVAWLAMGYAVTAWRLQILCRSAGVFVPIPVLASSYAMGLFFNCVLPTSVGGDAVRIMYLAKRGYALQGLIVTGIVDRLLGVVTLGLLSGVVLMVTPVLVPGVAGAPVWLGAMLFMVTVAGTLSLPGLARGVRRWSTKFQGRRMAELIEHYGDSLRLLRAAPGALAGALGLSVLAHVLVTLSYLACGGSLLEDFPWQGYFIAVPLVMLFQILPISLGGLGVRELSTVGVLVWLGADKAQALALSLAYLGVVWLSVLPGLVIAVYKGVHWQDVKRAELRNE